MGIEIDNPAGHSKEFITEIEQTVGNFLEAQNSGDGEKVADAFFEIVWLENPRQAFVDYMANFKNMGMEQRNEKFELRYLSPIVDTLGMQVISLRYYNEASMWFNENFVGDPASYFTNLQNLHGEKNVTYDAENRKYYFKGQRVAHAAKYTDDKVWKYMEDEFPLRVSSAIIPSDVYLKIRVLAKYE